MQENIGAYVIKQGRYNGQIEEKWRADREKNKARIEQEKYDEEVNEGVVLLETCIDDIKNNRLLKKNCKQEFICGRLRYSVFDVHVPRASIKLVNKKYRKKLISL